VPKTSESIDDYLKAILELAGPAGERATGSSLARHLGVSPASVTGMLQKLSRRRPAWILYRKHYGARLTEEGRRHALRVVRRHRLLELFLCEVLGFPWDEVHEEAEQLEHFISQKLEDRIAGKLGDPLLDPHGQRIPRKDGTLADASAVCLDDLAPGERAVIASVFDREPRMLRDLASQGLMPGRKLAVLGRASAGGSITVRLEAKKGTRVLSPKLARAVLVERSNESSNSGRPRVAPANPPRRSRPRHSQHA
jgi:DtxR family transcriptional regulator, Mn-dependent transcriptional regulator